MANKFNPRADNNYYEMIRELTKDTTLRQF